MYQEKNRVQTIATYPSKVTTTEINGESIGHIKQKEKNH